MKYKPHKYQLDAINFILQNPSAALFLDCGLGKTVITLSTLAILKKRGHLKKTLIIAPKRPAQTTWPNEIAKWDHLHDLTFVNLCQKTKAKRYKALEEDADLYIINRDLVGWLVEEFPGEKWPFKNIILDELSSFKSLSNRTKAILKIRPYVDRIVGLTGTPASNGYGDLWAEFKVLDLGERLYPTITKFRQSFCAPGYQSGGVVYSWVVRKECKPVIEDRISDMTLSMSAGDYLDMPELVTVEDYAYLDEDEQAIYDAFKDEYCYEYLDRDGEIQYITAANAAVLQGKLMQLSGGILYCADDLGEIEVKEFHEEKLEVLNDLVESQNGKPVLIAYWFKSDKTRIIESLSKIGINNISEINTPKDEENWNAGKSPVALIHPAKAGHGLNLQNGGNTLIWYTLPWSLELYIQTVDRLYRQGQQSGTVIVHHIITKKTVDEVVYKALQNKEAVQRSLLEAVKGEMRNA